MKIHYLAISVLFVSMIILGSVGWIHSLSENYGYTANLSSLNRTNESMQKLINDSIELNEKVTDFTLEASIVDVLIPYKLIQIGWSAVKIVFRSLGVIEDIIRDLSRGLTNIGLPLPTWFVGIVTAMLTITVVAIIIYAFFKWEFKD